MTATAEKTVTPRIMAVRLDVTEFCDADWLREKKIAKVFELHVYNERRLVHCCSLTPSYELRFVAHQWVWDQTFDSTDPANERFVEEVAEEFGEMDGKQDLYRYMDLPTIDHIPFNRRARYGHRQRFLVLGVADCKGMDHDEAEEKAWEYLRCNEV